MFRKLMRFHLWLGMLLALPLMLLSITGALLVFGPEIQAQLQPDEWYTTTKGEPLPIEELLIRFEQQQPNIKVNVISADQPEGFAWRFWLGGGHGTANVDPVSGEVIKLYNNNQTLMGYVRQIHRWLLVPAGDARPWARHLVSVVTLIFIIQIVMGIWMWAIPPRRFQRLKISFKSRRRRIMSRLHSLTGLAFAGVLLLVAFTGIAFNWKTPTRAIVNAITLSDIQSHANITANGINGQRNIDNAIAAAFKETGEGQLLSVNVPSKNTQPVNVRIRPAGLYNNTLIQVDPVTFDILSVQHAQNKTRAETFWGVSYLIHVGSFAGTTVKALWIIVALIPAFYVYSGVWIYLNRTRSKRKRKRINHGRFQTKAKKPVY